jgi:hypothetical protein
MLLTPGQKLRSTASSAQVIVIRAPGVDVDLTLAGAAVTADEVAGTSTGHGAALLVGKRYGDAADTLELLCTAPGDGPLAADGVELTERAAKSLPSSD